MNVSKLKPLYEEYRSFWDSLDRRSAQTVDEFPIICGVGCDNCCKQVIIVTLPEALAIVYGIRIRWTKEKATFFDAWITPKVVKQRMLCLSMIVTSASWFKNRRPCVLLRSSGECWAYDYRPSVCRSLLVQGLSEQCGPPMGQKIDAIIVKGWDGVCMEIAEKYSKRYNICIGMSPLPMAMYWANIIFYKGFDEYRRVIKGTVFEKDITSLVYWSQRFGSKEMRAEVDKKLNLVKIGEY